MNKEKLEIQKEDTERIIQELHKTADLLESNACIHTQHLTNAFIEQINKEIGYEEQILQDLNASIIFEDSKRIEKGVKE